MITRRCKLFKTLRKKFINGSFFIYKLGKFRKMTLPKKLTEFYRYSFNVNIYLKFTEYFQ